jgi:hypothetical protein
MASGGSPQWRVADEVRTGDRVVRLEIQREATTRPLLRSLVRQLLDLGSGGLLSPEEVSYSTSRVVMDRGTGTAEIFEFRHDYPAALQMFEELSGSL